MFNKTIQKCMNKVYSLSYSFLAKKKEKRKKISKTKASLQKKPKFGYILEGNQVL